MAIRETLSGAASDLVAMLHTRLELFSVELAQEKSRLFCLLGMACAALLFLVFALLVFSLFVVALFWDTDHRFLVIGLLAGFYALAGLALLAVVRYRLKTGATPFGATIDELGSDAQMFSVWRRQVAVPQAEPEPEDDPDIVVSLRRRGGA